MNLDYLAFEQPIAELEEKIEELRNVSGSSAVNITEEVDRLEKKSRELTKSIFSNLTAQQIVQLARHPLRPYTMDYISRIFSDFQEMQGDRHISRAAAMIGGMARFDGQPVMIIGHQKGRGTKEKLERNFGMASPEGFRKALRLMKFAEKFHLPVISFLDTPGAYPGIEAEERGQAEAIARNLVEMAQLKVPIVCIVIGEGASGGAIGIGLGDRVYMMENTWYSVISPESCSSILWHSWDYKEQAAEALKLTPDNMLEFGLIDEIIKEPVGGAHTAPEEMAKVLKRQIKKAVTELLELSVEDRIEARINKYATMGVYETALEEEK